MLFFPSFISRLPRKIHSRTGKRRKEDSDNECLFFVNGTSVCIALRICKKFYFHKTKKNALGHKIGLGIKNGDICWVNGGYPSGDWNDEIVFKNAQRAEANEGYRGIASRYNKCPGTVWKKTKKKEMKQRVRFRQETINIRLRIWKIHAVLH